MEDRTLNHAADEAEMDEALAEEIDRRVREAVEQARQTWAAEAAAEAERTAGMSGEERARYDLTRREAALAERERLLTERELRAMALEKLAERGLPRELADALPYGDEAKCLAGLDAVERAFRAAVQAGIDERLRGKAPDGMPSRNLDVDAMSDAEFYRLNVHRA